MAVESLLLAGLLLLAAWLLLASVSSAGQPESLWPEAWAERMPAYGSSEVMLSVFICVGLYGLLQFLGRSRLAFWLAALLALLPHAPGLWGHNQLEWQRFFGIDASFGAGHSLILTAGLFLMCLAGLIVLHRIIALRKLGLLLSTRRVEGAELDALLINEGLALAGMIASGLAVALLMVIAGVALGRSESLPGRVPWAIITIGGGASLLLIGFMALFLRGLDANAGAEPPAGE